MNDGGSPRIVALHQINRHTRRREGHSTKLSATVKEAVADAVGEISQEEAAEACPGAPGPRRRQDGGGDSLTSASGQRTYDHAIREFVSSYCSKPRLAFNRTVVVRYRIHLEQRNYAPATINLRLAAVRRVAYEAAGRQGWTCANRPDPTWAKTAVDAVADITHGPVFRAITRPGACGETACRPGALGCRNWTRSSFSGGTCRIQNRER